MADVLQNLGLESDFLQQLLSAGAEVAPSQRLRTDNGAAVIGRCSFTLQTPVSLIQPALSNSHLKTRNCLTDSGIKVWGRLEVLCYIVMHMNLADIA